MSTAITRRPRRPVPPDQREIIRIEIDRLTAAGLPPADHAQQRMIASVERFGILQPILVRPDRSAKTPRFFVIDGRRRLYAAIACGLSGLPCLLERLPDGEEENLFDAYYRCAGDYFAQAELLADRLSRCGLTQQELADRLNLSQSAIANKLRLLKLDRGLRAELLAQGLSERHARALVSVPASARAGLLGRMIDHHFTVAESESAAEEIRADVQEANRHQKGAIRDIGFFYNTIDRAVDLLARIGVHAAVRREEMPDAIRIEILVPRNVSRETIAQAAKV